MSVIRQTLTGLAGAAFAATLTVGVAQAADPIKIGVILPYSGPFADYGRQIENGMKLALAQQGDTIEGRKIELIRRDSTGPAPDIVKRLAQELVVRDKVDLLAGFGFTPNALVGAAISAEAKKPMVVMNAATSIITTKSPYLVRFSFTTQQMNQPMGTWAAKNGVKTAYTLVSDYGPGHDAEAGFTKAFTAGGGKVVGDVRVPLKSPDFSAYVQKIKDVKPEAVFVFLPAGEQAGAFVKTFQDQGLPTAGIKLLAAGDLTDDGLIETLGDAAIGMITSQHYSYAHPSDTNKAYVAAYEKAYPDIRPNFMSVAGYDGMNAIIAAIKAQGGKIDPDKTTELLKNTKMESPRGPIMIDPETRDIVQNMYIRRVERVGGKLVNVEFDTFPMVKDPGK